MPKRISEPTPGPWIAVEADEMSPLPAGVMVAVHAAAEPWKATGTICELNGQGDREYDPAVTNANARLIAAAPELLALCREVLSLFAGAQHDDVPLAIGEDRWDRIFAAVSRAEGRRRG